MKITPQELQLRISWTLDYKLEWFARRYAEFMIEMEGNCYRAFSGGKDSDMGCRLIEMIHDGTLSHLLPPHIWHKLKRYPVPPRVFNNTGLEFPEIVEHVKKFDHIETRPKMGFTRVIKEVGVAVISKEVAQKLREIRNSKSQKLIDKRLHGDDKGNGKIPEKWKYLIDAPFDITEKCCDILKKQPVKIYERKTKRKPIIFTMIGESWLRRSSYLQTGCNTFEEGKEKCRPYSIFTDEDTWELAERFNIVFAPVYYARVNQVEQLDGSVKTVYLEPECQTGCTFCLFGMHLDSKEKNNHIQRLAISHPKYYDIVINKCGLGKILDWLGFHYKPFELPEHLAPSDIL